MHARAAAFGWYCCSYNDSWRLSMVTRGCYCFVAKNKFANSLGRGCLGQLVTYRVNGRREFCSLEPLNQRGARVVNNCSGH